MTRIASAGALVAVALVAATAGVARSAPYRPPPAARAAHPVSASHARAHANALPAWLALRPGTVARVDLAPWATADEPEASLAASAASFAGDPSSDTTRPGDVVYEPVGVRVRVVRVFPQTHLALVHGIDRRFQAFARVERLVPVVPPGTRLRAAGGFGGFADFYATLATPNARAERLATGSELVALEQDAAPFDAASADLVRVRARVLTGDLRGRTGWVAVAFTGLPQAAAHAGAEVAEHACACRLVQFIALP
ncbi:MAG: hypothetical protein NVSMB59_21870 [Vulcanimicrobiaceae bacterium]